MFIRRYLLEKGEAYIHETWMAFARALKEAGIEWWGTYTSFRRYFYMLERLGLIWFVRSEPGLKPELQPRRYYAVVPEFADLIEAWVRPQVVLYPETVWGRKDYSKKVEEARKEGITIRELTLRERPELAALRARLRIY